MIRVAIALIAIGGTGKLAVKTYRKIKNKEFFTASALPKGYYKGSFQNPMTRREALLMLNLREGFNVIQLMQDQIIERQSQNYNAYKSSRQWQYFETNYQLIEGSTFIATKINEAKELLQRN